MKKIIQSTLFGIVLSSFFINSANCELLTNDTVSTKESIATQSKLDNVNQESYPYITVGIGPIIFEPMFFFTPNVGVGYRSRHNRLGWDGSISYSTIFVAHYFNGTLSGHYYLSPSNKNPSYIGLGVMGGFGFGNQVKPLGENSVSTFSPDFVFGKEFTKSSGNKNFIEVHVSVPTLATNFKSTELMNYPILFTKYGIKF